MAMITSRCIAAAFTLANVLFFFYSIVVLAGWTIGRSDPLLTKALVAMSFASLTETAFWIVWPTSGYSLYAALPLDLLAIGVLIYKYRNPREELQKSQSRTQLSDDSVDLDIYRQSMTPLSLHGRTQSTVPLSSGAARSSEFVGSTSGGDSPRRPSTQLPAPPTATTSA
jgi:hypothetical protein